MKRPGSRSDVETMRDQIELFSIAEGFLQSSVLFSLLKLKIFERIGEGSKTLHELSDEVGARPETLVRLLNAGVVLRLLETQDGVLFRVASKYQSVLVPSAGENYLGNWIRNLEYLNHALSKLDEAVMKSGPTVEPSTHLGSDKDLTREFMLAMHNSAALRGKELARFLDTTGCGTLLDLGCGPGTYSFNLGLRNPNLQLYLLDNPQVLDITKEIQARYPLENEVHYLPLDLMKDEIPGSYDLIFLSNLLHMFGEEANRKLVRRLYSSINQGGSLVIQAQFLDDDRLGGRWPIMLDLIQLCITNEGRNHTVAETRGWLEEAGFRNIEFCPMTLLNTHSFLRGYKS